MHRGIEMLVGMEFWRVSGLPFWKEQNVSVVVTVEILLVLFYEQCKLIFYFSCIHWDLAEPFVKSVVLGCVSLTSTVCHQFPDKLFA